MNEVKLYTPKELDSLIKQFVIHPAVPQYIRLAYRRHLDDLQHLSQYTFSPEHGYKVNEFASLLNHFEGKLKGEPFIPIYWQQIANYIMHGWRRADNLNYRRFTRAYIEVSRKNAKTSWAACNGLYSWLVESQQDGEAYCVATKKDQAQIGWNYAHNLCKTNPDIFKDLRVYTTLRILFSKRGVGKFAALAADHNKEDGSNPCFGLIDEYHAHSDNGMLEVIESGMAAQEQPMTFIITTAGVNLDSPCYVEERRKIVDILEGNLDDDTQFGLIYALDDPDNWEDSTQWIQANPSLGIVVHKRFLEARVKEAQNKPGKRARILTKNFNVWQEISERFIPTDVWNRCKGEVDHGRLSVLGTDLSDVKDLSALARATLNHGKIHLSLKFYMPKDSLLSRMDEDGKPYNQWAQDGYIHLSPGYTVDHNAICKDVLRMPYIDEITYDPHNAVDFVNVLDGHGYDLISVQQTFAGMSSYIKIFDKVATDGLLVCDNPIMDWMIGVTKVIVDDGFNKKLSKGKSSGRIDGVVAAVMAVGRLAFNIGLYGSGDGGGMNYGVMPEKLDSTTIEGQYAW